jgi:hypothetical protein
VTVAKRRKSKRKRKRVSFKLSTSKRKKKKLKTTSGPSLKSILKVLEVACVIAAAAFIFYFLERYVQTMKPVNSGVLELVDVPLWVNDALKERIYEAAVANGGALELDETAARRVQENVEEMVRWVDEVRVQTTHDRLVIEARWRKPVALVESRLYKFYVDAELVVLDFVEVSNLPIVRIKGQSIPTSMPPAGQVWQRDDAAAAVTILAKLEQMDATVTPQKPLLYEIDSIDVSNFEGRKNRRQPHIVLYTKDDTEIIWGAEFGTWQRYLEAPDDEKLAKLYSYYKEFGTLLGGAKYINLRDPQETIPRPTDKY